jgi:hypothetical protein
MTDQDETGIGTADDFEYDMAHESIIAAPPSAPPPLPPPESMHVDDDAGDYGYDAAHDRA